MDPTPFSPSPRGPNVMPMDLATRALVHLRAHELASADGYTAPYLSQANYEQAKREIASASEAQRRTMLQAFQAAENLELQLS